MDYHHEKKLIAIGGGGELNNSPCILLIYYLLLILTLITLDSATASQVSLWKVLDEEPFYERVFPPQDENIKPVNKGMDNMIYIRKASL